MLKLNKRNKIVGLNNIITGVLFVICFFILNNIKDIENRIYIMESLKQERVINLALVVSLIPVGITFLINIITTFKNFHNKKNMILNLLTLITLIIAFAFCIMSESINYFFIIGIIAIWGLVTIIFNRNEAESKKHIFLFAIIIINIILFITSTIMLLSVGSDFKATYYNNEKNLINSIMQISNKNNSSMPIRVYKDNKYGYVDNKGNIISDFIYYDATNFWEISIDNDIYYVALVSIENELKLITNDNTEIVSYKNKGLDCPIHCYMNSLDIYKELKKNAEELNMKISIETNEVIDHGNDYEKEKLYNSTYNRDADIYSFRIEDEKDNIIGELEYDKEKDSITYNNKDISIDGIISIKEEDDADWLYYYKNGNIPIYNFDEEIFGWIDLEGKANYFGGKIQIIDFTKKYIVIKDYSISGANMYIIDYEGNKLSKEYKQITSSENGFVVKKNNGKNTYLNEDLEESKDEYDIIDTSLIDQGVLIVSNVEDDDLENLKYDLINIKTSKTILRDVDFVGSMDAGRYNLIYEEDIEEYKDLIFSVDCDYINTELYKDFDIELQRKDIVKSFSTN